MKILLWTDNHFSTNSSILRSQGDKYSTRLENQIKGINWVNDLAIEMKCDKMIHLGDFFDKPELNAQEISALKEIKWNNLPKEFIVGNHEMASNDLTFNSLNVLTKIGKIIDKPTLDCGFGYELIYLPYILETNRKPLQEYIQELENKFYDGMVITNEVKERIILSHNDLAGIQFGQYFSKSGFNIKEVEENCNLFINGHLHNQQQISKKIINLGNLTGQNFSEDGFKYSHSVGILDTQTLELELIDNPYAFYFYKIDVNTLQELEKELSKCNKKYSIASIKINEEYIIDAKQICREKLKEFRLISKPNWNNIEHKENIEISKSDHIQQFKKYILDNIDYSDILQQELDLIK